MTDSADEGALESLLSKRIDSLMVKTDERGILSHSDFLLKLGSRSLPSFSWLLRRHSSVVSALLTNWSGEHDSSMTLREDDFSEDGISVETAVRLLASMCCGRLMVTEEDHPSKAMALLVSAERLKLHEISRAAEALLMTFVGDSSVCGLLQWADVYLGSKSTSTPTLPTSQSSSKLSSEAGARVSLRDSTPGNLLRAACVSHILRNFEVLTNTEDFAALPEELREEMLAIGATEGYAFALDRKKAMLP